MSRMRAFSVALMLVYFFENKNERIKPRIIPDTIPASIDTGTLTTDCITELCPPAASDKNTENSVIAKTSSMEAPAIIIVGTSFFLPRPCSLSESMEGTTTAGETAQSMKAVRPAAAQLKSNISLIIKVNAVPSKMQGIKDIRRAVRPAFFRVALRMPRPARRRMTMRAKDFKKGLNSHRTSGLRSLIKTEHRIPKITIPNIEGSFIFPKSLPNIQPPERMSASITLKDIVCIM